jgi:DNA polymerase-3 subunit delta
MRPQEFEQVIRNPEISPVFLFLGSEDLWKEKMLRLLCSVLKCDTNPFGFQRFRATEHPVSFVLDEANVFGFFNAKKVLWYRALEALRVDDQKLLLEYLKSPNPDTVLVLDALKLDGRSSLAQNALLKKNQVEFEIKDRTEVSYFIQGLLKDLGGLTITRDLESRLLGDFPNNLNLLAQNLEKMAAHNAYRSPLTLKNYCVVIQDEETINVFALMDAITDKNALQALQMQKSALREKDAVFGLVGLLRRQFELLLRAKEMLRQKVDAETITKQCRIPPFKKTQFLRQTQKMGEEEISQKYALIAECDYALKSTGQAQSHLFEMLVYNLCR